jgi:hypothetical protein
MRKLIPFLALFSIILTAPAPGQKKILVSPYGDAIPIGKTQSIKEVIKRYMAKTVTSAVCTDKATFGYTLAQNPGFETNHIAFHQDIVAMWYVAPASGTIDTVFWYASDVGSLDSTVTVRLFESNIYPGNGPGYGGYPKPGKLCWGYFINTNDIDNGVAAFPEDATDPTWYSTVSGATPSFTPMGNEIWGFGGAPKVEEAFAVNHYALSNLGVPNVTVGQPFFITIRIYGPHVDQATEDQTGFYAINEADSLQTHNWKFYEHIVEIQPGFTCPGWVARGDFNVLYWYAMTVTTNIPPTFPDVTALNTTFSTDPRVVQAVIEDCNPEDPLSAGVESASIRYTRNGISQPEIPLLYIGGDTWEGEIPGGSVDDLVAYKIVAADSNGFVDSTGANQYRIVSLRGEWYTADTGATCTEQDISATGTPISSSAFFVPQYDGSGTAPMDDGTAGPFDMGFNFMFFGDTFRYAWVGVNGALALSKNPLDTLDVNANGFATTFWDFPNAQTAGRTDTAGASDMPGMFIAPFWADLIIEDTVDTYGTIRYGNNADTCLFIVEWDSVGAFLTTGAIDVLTTFRAVLNRCDGTVEFQYKSVGTTGLDSAALVGMQADSNEVSGPSPGWVFVNRNTHPIESKPRDGWCVRLSPNISTVAIDGWNMVAVSLEPNDAVYTTASLFPQLVSSAYKYEAGYVPVNTLGTGLGYWMKFNGAGAVGSSAATFLHEVTAPVGNGWNIIGGPSEFVATGEISPTGVTISSPYFGFGSSGYFTASSIQPGRGYWVKVSGNGSLSLEGSTAVPKAITPSADLGLPADVNRIVVTDAAERSRTLYAAETGTAGHEPAWYEMPPRPPHGGFDVRFGSGRFYEEYTLTPAADQPQEFPLVVQGAAYPLTIRWSVGSPVPDGRKMVLASVDGKTVYGVLEGSGSLQLAEAPAAHLTVRFLGGFNIPTEFALSRNYPNPFNPATRFTVDLPREAAVEVVVFDLLGRKIATLVDDTRAGGSYTVEWNGQDANGLQMPTGTYIVRMISGEFSDVRKVMLMK